MLANFENVEISKDNVHNSLALSSDIFDGPTKQCLCIFIRSMLDDHLKDGKYANPCEELHKGTVGVSATNSISEQNFNMMQ